MPRFREDANQRPLGTLLAVAAAITWSSLGMLGRLAMNLGVDPLSLVTWRTVFAGGLILLALVLFRRRLLLIPLRSVPLFALLGLCQAVNFVAFFQAVARLEVGVAVSLFYVYPVLATVLAW
ncbi:MAG: DMT family transporter, partial [Candidatus Bipolaricaulota bacterium]|nr:DMT family transporter [Candidatus Bipolaricaulota bacterium]